MRIFLFFVFCILIGKGLKLAREKLVEGGGCGVEALVEGGCGIEALVRGGWSISMGMCLLIFKYVYKS